MTDRSKDSPRRLRDLLNLLPFVARYRALVAGWLGFLAISSAATLTLPQAVRVMIDHGFANSSAATINASFVGLFAVAAVLAVATAARFFCVSLLGERVAADLRRRLYDHLLTLDQAFFEKTRTGELVSRLAADTELVQTVVGLDAVGRRAKLCDAARCGDDDDPFELASCGAFGARDPGGRAADRDFRPPRAETFAREPGPHRRRVRDRERIAERDAHGAGLHARAEGIGALRRRGRTRACDRTPAHRDDGHADLTAMVILLTFGAITLVLWAGAQAVVAGTMAVGVLSQFVLYAVLAGGSVGALTEVWGEVMRASGAVGRISELLATTADIRSPASPTLLAKPVRGAVRFEHVEFRYPSRPDRAALHDFSLAISPGETVALVGPSGAGKSTVFQLLLRFHDPLQGRITLDGVDLRALALSDLRGAFALVPQDPVLFGASAGDNIGFGRSTAGTDAIIAAARAAEAHDFLDLLPERYETYLGERGVRLSGGQQQRVAIARALLRDAPILLLDEATSSLDAQSEHAVQQALERLMQNRTTIVIAHRLATVQRADRIVVMDGGRIVAEGTHAELVRQDGLYAELARLQFAA